MREGGGGEGGGGGARTGEKLYLLEGFKSSVNYGVESCQVDQRVGLGVEGFFFGGGGAFLLS